MQKNIEIIDLTCGKIKAIRVKISKKEYKINRRNGMTDFLAKIFIKNYKNTGDPSVRESYGTLAGYVMEKFGGLPEVGQNYTDENMSITVREMDVQRIISAEITVFPKDDEDEDDDKVTKQSIEEFRGLVKKGPDNLVETFEGFLMSTIDRIKQAVPKSKLDWDTVQVSDNPFEFHAPDFEVRVDSKLQ